MNQLAPQVAPLVDRLRSDPMSQGEVRRSMAEIVRTLPSREGLYRALEQLAFESDDLDFQSAMDAVLEVVPPGDDWIWEAGPGKWRPDASRVAKRALCLGTLFWRAVGELAGDANDQSAWTLSSLDDELTDAEREALKRAASSWKEGAAERWTDGADAFVVLAWALRLSDLTPFDRGADGGDVIEILQTLRAGSEALHLRPFAELQAFLDESSLWRKRSQLQPDGNRTVIPALLRSLGWSFPEGSEEARHGDLVAFGKPVWQLDDDEFDHLSTVAWQRYLAATWLCGGVAMWDADRA